jgi:hypothetical protein
VGAVDEDVDIDGVLVTTDVLVVVTDVVVTTVPDALDDTVVALVSVDVSTTLDEPVRYVSAAPVSSSQPTPGAVQSYQS